MTTTDNNPFPNSTRNRRRARRSARRHAAACDRAGLVERAETWRKRARNG